MFLHPLGLFALAAVPAVVALHLYRRRYKPTPVAGLFLWSAEDLIPAAGRRREPLRRSLSFWCEVLAALLLALVFAGPRPLGVGTAQHAVIVLDASASLGARGPAHDTLAEARAAVTERIARLPRGSRVTLVTSGVRPKVLAGPAALPVEARERLQAFAPGLAHTELGPALALAFELSGARAVTVVTDRFEPGDFPPEVELVAVGAPLPNAGIVAVARRRADGRERIALTVANMSAESTRRELTLTDAAGRSVAARTLDLAAGAELHTSFELADTLDGQAPALTARLTPADALAADDVAYLAPAPRRTLRLAAALRPELAAALGVDGPDDPSPIDRWLALVPDALDVVNPAAAHLVLCEGLEGLPEAAWALAVAAPGEEREHFIGPFLLDPSHALLGGVTLEGVVWAAARGATLAGAPLVSAGAEPLGTELVGAQRTAWLLNLDPLRSNVTRSPDWPILLSNAAEARRAALPGPAATTLSVGQPLRVRVERPQTLELRGPRGSAQTYTVRDSLVVDDLEEPGMYTLHELGAGGESELSATFGVSLADRRESDLTQRSAGVRAAVADEATLRAGFSWIEVLLLTAALALLGLDWWALRRPFAGVATA